MTQHPIFFVFAVIGFVQAYDLLPPQWAFVSVGATSLMINLIPGGVPDTPERIAIAVASVEATGDPVPLLTEIEVAPSSGSPRRRSPTSRSTPVPVRSD